MSNIEIKNLCKKYEDHVVFEDVDATFEEGTFTCLMGPSGCGKTTLLRLIAGLETADKGEIHTNGMRISFVFQEDRLSENFSAVSNIKFVVGKAVSSSAIRELLNEFELEDAQNKPVRELSGGMKRRVAIARALCAPYDLLIMDEPLKGLDEKLKDKVIRIIRQRTEGKTVICVTHDQDEAERFESRILHWENM